MAGLLDAPGRYRRGSIAVTGAGEVHRSSFTCWRPFSKRYFPPPQETPQVSPQVERLLAALEGEMTLRQMLDALGLSDRKSFRQRYLLPALEQGYVEMTLAESPTARNQRYRLTMRGREVAR